MTIQVTGLLKNSSGAPSPNTPISLLTIKGADGVLPSAIFDTITDDKGDYDFSINIGVHYLSVRYESVLEKVAKVTVNTDTPSPQTLDTLLALEEPLLPGEIIIVQQLLAEAIEAATQATNSAQAAADSVSKIADTTGGIVVNRVDANGNQNVMVKVPVMTNAVFNAALGTNWLPAEAPHPAFIRPDGTTMSWFEFGMYTASNDGKGNPVSAAYKDPYVNVTFDQAKSKCSSMGTGWGLVSNAQWAAVSLFCLMNGYQPLGNTYYGYSHERSYLGGIRQDGDINGDASGSARILTGSGPVEFRHNKIMQGIADMTGNVWEWVDGLKLVDSRIFVEEYSRQAESSWAAQAAFLDVGMKLNSERTGTVIVNGAWSSLGSTETYTPNQLLQQLMIEPITQTGALMGYLYYNNDGEQFSRRGGHWFNNSRAGLGALVLSYGRSYPYLSSDSGFRPAYFEQDGKSQLNEARKSEIHI